MGCIRRYIDTAKKGDMEMIALFPVCRSTDKTVKEHQIIIEEIKKSKQLMEKQIDELKP